MKLTYLLTAACRQLASSLTRLAMRQYVEVSNMCRTASPSHVLMLTTRPAPPPSDRLSTVRRRHASYRLPTRRGKLEKVRFLGMRTRRPRFESRVAPLFHWVATVGKLFTHIASAVSQLQETGVQMGVFGT